MIYLGVVGVALICCGIAIAGIWFGFPRQRFFSVTPDDRVVDVLGSKMRYRVQKGDGPLAILIHGNNLSIEDWEDVVSRLPGRNLISIDLIGYAGSERPSLPYSVETQRKYIIAFMDAVGIESAVLVGHSMGGAVAAWTAAKSSDRISGVVIISPPGIPGSLVYRLPKGWLCRPSLLNRIAFFLVDTPLFRRAFPTSLAPQGLGVTYSYNEDYANALNSINQPSMLIWSGSDTRTLISYAKMYQERMGDLEFVQVPDEAGHMVPRTYPEGTAALIGRFLDRVSQNEISLGISN